MTDTGDGFVIAEKDLQIRGPGDFFGTRQHGLPQLRAGDLTRDVALLELAFSEARTRVDAGTLSEEERHYVLNVWQRQFGLIEVG
jgi:ATP-dependent DNA helicase RecG